MMDDYEKIRKFEAEVLDEAHKKFAFYNYSEDIVIPFLLQVYGDTERYSNKLIRDGHNESNLLTYLNNMMHGIGHCIRWMANQKYPKFHNTYDKSPREVLEMAADFLGWGTGYHIIAQEFATWSRKIKIAILDETNKTIKFLNPEGYDYSSVYEKQFLYRERIEAVYLSYPHSEIEKEFCEWLKDIDISMPPISDHVNWEKIRGSKLYPMLSAKMEEIIFPELSEPTDFDGYNLQQLRQFYTLFFLNFYFLRRVEDLLDSISGESISFGSKPLYLSAVKFEQLASLITGLPINVSNAIIADLTFNPNNFHTSVIIQPFVLSSTGTYYILPNLFSDLEPSRMILGALNKGSKKHKYDKLINLIEKENLSKLYISVDGVGRWICYLEKIIRAEGKQIHPDLILIDENQKCLCIVDYKHFIGPITASEVNYKMNELSKGTTQVKNYIQTFAKLKKIGLINLEGFAIHGLIITHKPLPVPISKNIGISITDLTTFIEHTKIITSQNQGLTELIKVISINEREGVKKIITPVELEIAVGEWKIIRSQHKITQSI